jgi:Mg/Co/Ni transporter MgtE
MEKMMSNDEDDNEETVDSTIRMCSSVVNYKDRQGACQKPGKYPDADGVRIWCGLHNPDRQAKAKLVDAKQDSAPVVDMDVLVGLKDHETDELLQAMDEAYATLFELANTSVVGWSDNTPSEKYKIIIAHMADRAKEAAHHLGEKIRRLRS